MVSCVCDFIVLYWNCSHNKTTTKGNIMERINLHRLAVELYSLPKVEDANVVSCECSDDAIDVYFDNDITAHVRILDDCPDAAVYALFADGDMEPLDVGYWRDIVEVL